jgi:tRNA-specific 2-thiouridylase
MRRARPHIYVALSGGVDSSVAAAELVQAGYRVTGAFIRVWQPPFAQCDWRAERHDAMRVSAHLNIPFRTIDLSDTYKQSVVDYMIREYRAGRTPNPDVMCNYSVKFGAFLHAAHGAGADMIATGHHARVMFDEASNTYLLRAGVDSEKDQTYFLWTLTQDVLAHTHFPVGHYTKDEVRQRARAYGLPTAAKKDSQGLCFLGKIAMRDFLKQYVPEQHGAVLNENGSIIGEHEGAHFYTLGQRHGFTVYTNDPHETPRYVIGKDVHANTITVSAYPQQSEAIVRQSPLEDSHIISGAPKYNAQAAVRYRYRQPLHAAYISAHEQGAGTVWFSSPQFGVTAGQSLVWYDNEICRGGAILR